MTEGAPVVFLSASFPEPERGEAFPPNDPAALADAVTALSREILRRGATLLCGGHPTITPLLQLVCAEGDFRDSLVVFQSERFRDQIPAETWRLSEEGWGRLEFTPESGDRARDLEVMRRAMLSAYPLVGAIFVGGMEGIVDEFGLVEELAPDAPRFAVRAPGGAAATLEPTTSRADVDPDSRRYLVLARAIAEEIGLGR